MWHLKKDLDKKLECNGEKKHRQLQGGSIAKLGREGTNAYDYLLMTRKRGSKNTDQRKSRNDNRWTTKLLSNKRNQNNSGETKELEGESTIRFTNHPEWSTLTYETKKTTITVKENVWQCTG